MSGPEYLALAWRLPAYQGVLAARIAAEQEEEEGPRRRDGAQRVEGTRAAIEASPALAGVIDWG